MLLAIAVLLLTSKPASDISAETTTSSKDLGCAAADRLGDISHNKGSLLFAEHFQSAPLGYNSSEWNHIEINDPSFAWKDGESIDLWGEQFKSALLRSNRDFGPGIITEMNASFTKGTCYSFIGWCDKWQDTQNDWIANGRLCQNGVFIDCWDGELFLVAYSEGDRTVTSIEAADLNGWQIIRIEWTESVVRLEIDSTLVAFVSRTIPQSPLPMTFMVSGHHSRVEPGRLSLESVGVYDYQRESEPSDPEIVLLRPENNSIVYPRDILDFEVRGTATNLSCSWEKGPFFKMDSPWDTMVPGVMIGGPFTFPASIHLTVQATSPEGHTSTIVYAFQVDEREFEFGVWEMPTQPVVDGIVDEYEAEQAGLFEVGFRSECGEEVRVDLLTGFTSDSLYVAVESPIPDSFHSRAILFLDVDADGSWNMQTPDLGVSIASPSADSTYTGVFGLSDSLIPNLMTASSEASDIVVYEFLIPLTDLSVDSCEGIALAVQLLHGGYNLDFPDKYSLGLVYSLGVPAPNLEIWQFGLLVAVLSMTGAVFAVLVYKSRKETHYLERTFHDEPLQRIKILLLSYERIDLSRLSRMVNMESHVVESLVEDLIEKGFPVYRVNSQLVRFRKTTGNDESNIP
ncbi:MAG: hypothetical protein ACFFCK_06690 [Promethearchaeota archaeon]